jgi:hypothetical protein
MYNLYNLNKSMTILKGKENILLANLIQIKTIMVIIRVWRDGGRRVTERLIHEYKVTYLRVRCSEVLLHSSVTTNNNHVPCISES